MWERIVSCLLIVLAPNLSKSQIANQFAYSETFGMSEGLEHSVISDITTDANDFLWITVNGHVQLFDGDQFIDMTHLVHTSLNSGQFGFQKSSNVFLLKDQFLYKITPQQYTENSAQTLALPASTNTEHNPRILYEDKFNLFIAHPNDSLYQVDKESFAFKKVFDFYHPAHAKYGWNSFYISPDSVTTIPYIDRDSIYCRFNLSTGTIDVDHSRYPIVQSALAAGDTMISLQKTALDIYTEHQEFSIPLPESGHKFNGQRLLLLGRDSLLVSLANSVYVFNLRTMEWVLKLQTSEGESDSEVMVRKMTMDRKGHLFISTFNSGFVKIYSPNRGFQHIGTQNGKDYFVKCIRVSETANLVLAGTLQNGLLVFDTNGVLKHHIQKNAQNGELKMVTAIIKISPERYIVISDTTFEIIVNHDQYTLNDIPGSDMVFNSYYNNALEDHEHQEFYICNRQQIIRADPHVSEPLTLLSHLYYEKGVSATPYKKGLAVSAGNELILYDESHTPHVIRFNLPDIGYSRCLIPYAESQFLLATDLGLILLDTLQPDLAYQPLYDHMVYAILPGKQPEEFWFSTDFGLFHLDKNLQYKHYSIESGLQGNEFNTNSCYKSESGKLYFGGVKGITAFYPDNISKQTDTPRSFVSLYSMNGQVQQRYIPEDENPEFTFSHNENVFHLRLIGVGKRSPKRYNHQYMIKGIHNEWVNLGSKADIQLQLNPGHHTLYYHVGEKFNKEIPASHHISLIIQPPLYKRWWFTLMISLLPLLFFLYLLNQRRRRHAMEIAFIRKLDKKLQEERVRISRDLHDNIGAQMATVKRGINFLLNNEEQLSNSQTRDNMKYLESISTNINQELRDTIWVVKNEQISISSFVTRLKNFVYQLTGPESHYRVSTHAHGQLETVLGPYTALNLYRICQEAINNILKHAEASEISITFNNSDQQLAITISDNGNGFDLNQVKEGYGLGNIRTRAGQIGATLEFDIKPGMGSTLHILYSYQNESGINSTDHGKN